MNREKKLRLLAYFDLILCVVVILTAIAAIAMAILTFGVK